MKTDLLIPKERVVSKIIHLREENVILDLHLAELYGVETRILKQAVKRNIGRFPADFMFELTDNEVDEVVSQNVIPHKKFFGGSKPFAFTEMGISMLSSVLKSDKAVEMNILIIRTFVALRKLALNYSDLVKKLETMELTYNENFREIYAALQQVLYPEPSPRKRIGYKPDES